MLREKATDPLNPHVLTSLLRLIDFIDDREHFDFDSIAGVGARDLIWDTLRCLRRTDPSCHLVAYPLPRPHIVQFQTKHALTALAAIATLSNTSKRRRKQHQAPRGLPHELWSIIAHQYLVSTRTEQHPENSVGHAVCKILFGTDLF
jgi:hypothetical protein